MSQDNDQARSKAEEAGSEARSQGQGQVCAVRAGEQSLGQTGPQTQATVSSF